MKNSISKKLSLAFASSAFGLALSFSAMAATPAGTLEGADNSSVYGWVWDSDSYGHVIPVEISVYPADSSEVLKIATVKADHYQEKLQESIGDGYHGFTYSVDWNQFDDEDFRVTAYAATETERVFLGELTYNKVSDRFLLNADSSEEASFDASSLPESEERTVFVAGPGETSVSRQAPEPASSSSRNKAGASVSTQAPRSAASSSQNTPGDPVSPQALEPDSASSPSAAGSSLSAQASEEPGFPSSQDTAGSFAASGQSVAKASASSHSSESTTAASSENTDTSSGRPLLSWEKGPGFVPKKEEKPKQAPVSLGMFTVTGYCSCEICCPSSSSKLTYSGTEPQPDHTVSADIDVFPIGTRLMIDDIIYTVEDIGSNVTENKIDIFYATHEEALAHGITTAEVFAVPE